MAKNFPKGRSTRASAVKGVAHTRPRERKCSELTHTPNPPCPSILSRGQARAGQWQGLLESPPLTSAGTRANILLLGFYFSPEKGWNRCLHTLESYLQDESRLSIR